MDAHHPRGSSGREQHGIPQMPTDPVCGMTVDPQDAAGTYAPNCCGLIEMDTLIRVIGSSEEVSDDDRQTPYLYRGIQT
jgi:hypothetical protein